MTNLCRNPGNSKGFTVSHNSEVCLVLGVLSRVLPVLFWKFRLSSHFSSLALPHVSPVWHHPWSLIVSTCSPLPFCVFKSASPLVLCQSVSSVVHLSPSSQPRLAKYQPCLVLFWNSLVFVSVICCASSRVIFFCCCCCNPFDSVAQLTVSVQLFAFLHFGVIFFFSYSSLFSFFIAVFFVVIF